jgi:hypothetical protein
MMHMPDDPAREGRAASPQALLALLRADHSALLAAARAAVAADRDGCPDPVGLIRGVLAERGQLPPAGMTPQQAQALAIPALPVPARGGDR